uniref:X-ray repair cross-complementing protein 5-like n=1 Tax=Styela clava TaxID=7725 RepID=UPI0019396436|nr:X-ray repair cross-complementing protein 5-like [Styela clava]
MADFNFYDDLGVTEEGQDDQGTWASFSGRDSVMIAVDCCEQMFQLTNDDDESCPFNKICEAAKDMLRNKIICSERDLQALVFFGTEETKNPSDFKNIYVVQDLDSSSAARIEELQTLQDSTEADIKLKYGQCNDHQISDLLWCCSSIFSRTTVSLSSKTLILFTWEDDPHHGDRNAHLRARTKAKDLMEQDITIQVLSFNRSFDYEKFYKDIISDVDADVSIIQNPVDGITNLYDFLLRKCSKQRAMGTISFQLFDGMEMYVGVYTAARRATKSSNVNIDSTSNEEAFAKTNFVEKDTGDILLPGDIKLSQKWGNRDIMFENDEVADMRKFFGTGMKLLGFKPTAKAVKPWLHVKAAQFIYPNEKAVKGSTTLFSALLIKCIERDVVPICSLSARSNTAPRCVALLPQQEVIDETTGEQKQSPGFYVIFLPFSEDMRNIELKETKEPDEEAVKTAGTFIRKLKFTYHPMNFDNPALQTHYRNLEAMALEKDAPDEIDDLTQPNFDRITKKAGDLIAQFKEQVYPSGYDPTAKVSKPRPTATKRKTEAANGGTNAKQMNIADIKELASTGKLAKLTVSVLKEFCKNNGINVTGKKQNFIDAIEEKFL